MAALKDRQRAAGAPGPWPEAHDRVARALKSAFPLPDSGTFQDLLDAITSASDKGPSGPR
jgi:hypothetical protein